MPTPCRLDNEGALHSMNLNMNAICKTIHFIRYYEVHNQGKSASYADYEADYASQTHNQLHNQLVRT